MTALPGRLEAFRRTARERYESLPWPVRTEEEWRRTDPAWIALSQLELKTPASALATGWEPPTPEAIQAGVILTDLATALKQFPERVEEYLFQSGTPEGLAKFVALHQALANQGLFCYVPDGVRVEKPLKANLSLTRSGAAVFPHVLIVVGREAELTLVDERRSAAPDDAPSVSDEMVEVFLKAGAILRYVRVQRWGPSLQELFTQRSLLERDAQLLNIGVGLGGGVTKAAVETVLQGPGARSELLGVFFGSDRQHFDIHTLQDHQAERTFSDLLYKAALKDQAKSVYTGLIRIGKKAQKSDAYQANRNLLLSQGAKADSVPMLEIEANDVRCTHGVAVGPVDPEQAFYLMSRGLSEGEAEQMIVEGFFEQLLRRLPLEEIREELAGEIASRVRSHA